MANQYLFTVPEYIYKTTDIVSPILELFRLKQINTIIYSIRQSVQKVLDANHISKKISDKKVRQYFSQLLMSIYSNRTMQPSNKITLSDGLFNLPMLDETKGFYRDLNFFFGRDLFKNDEFDLVDLINGAIKSITNFVQEHTSHLTDVVYQFDTKYNKFTLDLKTLAQFNLDKTANRVNDLVIDNEILNKNRAKYLTNPFGEKYSFLSIMLVCLLRYHALGSGANQFVVDIEYKKRLREFGFNFECFASAINHFYDYYGSLFYDIEKYLGSQGSFMAIKIVQGCYMANPPYDDKLLANMYQKVIQSLGSNKPVAFIMSLPKWPDFWLENQVDTEHVYRLKKLKYEFFMNPLSKKMVLIPPYVSYLFYNDAFIKKHGDLIESLGSTFMTFQNYHLEFPARNKHYDDKYKIMLFKRLLKENLVERTSSRKVSYPNVKLNNIDYLYQGQYHYVVVETSKYKYYMLSDLFNDECRMHCTFDQSPSPYQYFSENTDKIIESLLKKNIPINPITLRDEIYQQTKECSTHNPLLIKFFIKKFSARKILDFSSGWGDRLIGALLSNIDLYVGVDPNECLHKNYHEMINLLKPYSPNPSAQYIMALSPFEKYDIPENLTFDLLYTSPPYFDYELYNMKFTESIQNFQTEDLWLHNFLFVAITKSLARIKIGGHLVIYLSQKIGKTYTEKFITWAKWQPNLYYLGNIFKSDEHFKKLHPIFIFEKNDKIPIQLYDPPMVIDSIIYQNMTLNVVREDLLIGGSKTRGSVKFLADFLSQNPNVDELIYTGASNGYGQIAVAYALYLLKSDVKLRIYYQSTNLFYVKHMQNLVTYLYPYTNYLAVEDTLKNIWAQINMYLESHPNSRELPLGLDDPKFNHYFATALEKQLASYVDKIQRLWLVGGSGTLYNILYKILPETKFHLVQVGRSLDISPEQAKRTTLYKSTFKLYRDVPYKIPYPTVQSYDAKIWEFSDKFQNNDYIWNVAGIHNVI